MNKRPIILIGDSLTFGFGVPKKESFAYKLKEALPTEDILNKGVNGDTSTGILSRYYRDVISINPKTVFIMCGTNDLLSKRSVDSIVFNIELMIKDLLNINAKIILGIPPFVLKNLAEELFSYSPYYDYAVSTLPILREKLLSLKEKYPLEIFDFYTLTKSKISNGIYLDGIHLNEQGNFLIFESLLKSFK